MDIGFKTYHPMLNFIYFAIVIFTTMTSMHPIFLILSFIFSLVYWYILTDKSSLFKTLKMVITIILLLAIFNSIFVHKGATILFFMNEQAITLESIIYGLASGVMMSSSIVWFMCFNEIMTSEKIVHIFGRFSPSLSLVLSMTFRFIPLFKEQFKEISKSQRNIGRGLKEGNIFKRIKHFSKEFSILITWSLENSIETSDSMRARGYGLKGRTSFTIFRFDRRDFKVLMLLIVMSFILFLGIYKGYNHQEYYPLILFEEINLLNLIVYVAYLGILLLPIIIDVMEEYKWQLLISKM